MAAESQSPRLRPQQEGELHMPGPDATAEIRRYLDTGEHDMLFPAWSGVNTVDRLNRGHRELLAALVAEVKRRAGEPVVPPCLRGLDLVGFGRKKAEPMVRGLFPRSEQGAVLDLVGRSLLFVTQEASGPSSWAVSGSTPLGQLPTCTWAAPRPNCSGRAPLISSDSARN